MASQPSRTLQDVVFGIHFAPSPTFNVLDLASWVEAFKEAGLDLQQQAPLPTVQWSPARQQTAGFQGLILGPMSQMPRIFLRGDNVSDYLVFQHDRLAFAWHRTEPVGDEANYPGYDALRGRWQVLLDRFNRWSVDHLGGVPLLRHLEFSYQNAFPIEEPEGSSLHVPQYFKLGGFGDRPLEQFHLGWRELVPNTDGGYVDAVATIGTVPPATPAFIFNFSAMAPLSPSTSADTVFATADAVHTHIRAMYAATIALDAF